MHEEKQISSLAKCDSKGQRLHDVCEEKDAPRKDVRQSHTETKTLANQSLSLCHVYYCFSNTSANQKNNYGNKDFSKGFQTLFLKLSSLSQHPNSFPQKPAVCHCLCRLCKPGGASPLPHTKAQIPSWDLGVLHRCFQLVGFGEDGEQGTARSVELQEYFGRLSPGANKPWLRVLNTRQSPTRRIHYFNCSTKAAILLHPE